LSLHESQNLPSPLFAKEGENPSLWQREGRRDFINNVVIIMRLLIKGVIAMKNMRFLVSGREMDQVVPAG